ncbi:DNA mismatch repair protein MutL, partial [Enterococcus faecalis]|nr:DNA mismatch repair protein MutL [Enterococcus faecalis]
NLAKSTTRQTQKPEQTSLPLKESTLYYDTTRQDFFVKSNQTSSQVAEGLVGLQGVDNPVNLGVNQAESLPPRIKFAQRSQKDETYFDHPELNHKELEKALVKLENEEKSTFPELEYFGQMHGTYLFAQGNGGLYIIDQHAAQERVKYEYYREKIGEVDSSQQQLLVPYIFEFPSNDMLLLKERMASLREIGVHLEEYGVNQFILREHPIWFQEDEIETAVYEMCDMLLLTKEVSIKRYRAELAIMMSCKRSIKANHKLEDYSARNLLVQLSQCDNPYNCPHGRPVLVNFTKSDMEKMFR